MSISKQMPVILVTNDDSIHARGIKALIEAVKGLGKVYVIAPTEAQSGMGHAITVKTPLWINSISKDENLEVYSCNGTPVDCVKLGFSQVIGRHPDVLVSGINHGANSSTSILYSGTMGAALEGTINQIPSIGFSLLNHSSEANFDSARLYARKITRTVIESGLPKGVALNVNIPDVTLNEIKGVRVCRQNMGYWKEEFEKRVDPRGREYYWLTGEFHNSEPDAEDTDEWALANNYVSLVPSHIDLTAYESIESLRKLSFEPEIKKPINKYV